MQNISITPNRNLVPAGTRALHLPPPARQGLRHFFVPVGMPVLDMSHEWDRTVCAVVCLAFSSDVFKAHLRCRLYQNIPFDSCPHVLVNTYFLLFWVGSAISSWL